jgi:branched-chain amino acid aminotransferase
LTTVIHVGGRFVAPEEAVVPLLDPGYLLGDGVFATMRGYEGACFRPEEHLAEIERGASMFGIRMPASTPAVLELVDEAARRTGTRAAYVRVTLTRSVTADRGALSIIARPMDVPSAEAYAQGVATVTVSPRRIPPACIDGTIKTTSYAVQVLARREVQSRGAVEGIQLAIDDSLACGTMGNLFVLRGTELLTPSLSSGCRAGVTRRAVLELAPGLGLTPKECRLDPSIFVEADEAFLTSTRVECLPIATVDGKRIGKGTFPRTKALRGALIALVEDETSQRAKANVS